MKLYRAHGLGNDYLVLEDAVSLDPALVRDICDRHSGVGGDGVLEPVPTTDADFGVKIWNPDGTVAEKSGNGLRIYAAWLHSFQGAPDRFSVWTGWDRVQCQVCSDAIEIEMGQAKFKPELIPVESDAPVRDELWEANGLALPVTVVSMGNPHCVAFAETALDDLPWRAWGAHWESEPRFPNRTNVQIGRILQDDAVEIRIWERGAGETLASGSSSCAVAVAGVLTGRLKSGWVDVRMPGGTLHVHVGADYRVLLRGPVELIGRFEVDDGWLAKRGLA